MISGDIGVRDMDGEVLRDMGWSGSGGERRWRLCLVGWGCVLHMQWVPVGPVEHPRETL